MNHSSSEFSPRTKKNISIISVLIFILVMAFLAWLIGDPMIRFLSEPDGFRQWVESHGIWGPLLFVLMMALQIIVAVIPAGPLEMAAGYAFGTLGGVAACSIGSLLGSAVVFLFVNRFGYKAVDAFISRDKINSLRFLKDNKRLDILVFIFFLIPGAPKDVLTYFIGLTPMKLGTFLLITTIARIPTFVMSVMSGSALEGRQYLLAILLLAASLLLAGIGVLIYRAICRKHAVDHPAEAAEEASEE